MAIGEEKIIQAFEEHFPNVQNLVELDRPGQKIKFQFQDKWYEVDANVNMPVFYASSYLAELKKRAVNAVLGRKESYPPGSEKEEKSQEYKEKLFYASCRAMQGIISSSMAPESTNSILKTAEYSSMNFMNDMAIEFAKDLLEKLEIK